VEIVASLFQSRTAAAQCGLFTHKSVPVIFEPPCIQKFTNIAPVRIHLYMSHIIIGVCLIYSRENVIWKSLIVTYSQRLLKQI